MNKIVVMAALAGAMVSTAAMAQNTGARLTDGSAIFDLTSGGTGNLPTVSTSSAANVTMNFQLDGAPGATGTRQIFTGGWAYRVAGDTRERSLFSAASRTLTGTNQVDYTFGSVVSGGTAPVAIAGVTAAMQFIVNDTGADSALLTSRLRINNNSNSDLSIDLFNTFDIDLAGTFPGDAYAPLSTSGGNRTWTLTDGTWTGIFQGTGAHGAGVGGFSAINGQMTDTTVDNFIPDLNAGGIAAADNAAVMQWRVIIPAGGSFTAESFLGIGRNGVTPVIPAPGAAALLAVGGLMAARRRRTA